MLQYFLNENVWILIKISLKFVPTGPINNIPALVQIMAWRRPGAKPLCEPMMVSLPMHICITQPHWLDEYQDPTCSGINKCINDSMMQSLHDMVKFPQNTHNKHPIASMPRQDFWGSMYYLCSPLWFLWCKGKKEFEVSQQLLQHQEVICYEIKGFVTDHTTRVHHSTVS